MGTKSRNKTDEKWNVFFTEALLLMKNSRSISYNPGKIAITVITEVIFIMHESRMQTHQMITTDGKIYNEII